MSARSALLERSATHRYRLMEHLCNCLDFMGEWILLSIQLALWWLPSPEVKQEMERANVLFATVCWGFEHIIHYKTLSIHWPTCGTIFVPAFSRMNEVVFPVLLEFPLILKPIIMTKFCSRFLLINHPYLNRLIWLAHNSNAIYLQPRRRGREYIWTIKPSSFSTGFHRLVF